MNRRIIREVVKRHASEMLAISGVVGIGVGESQGKPCILVFVRDKRAVVQKIPNTLEGYIVRVEESGDFRARTG